MTFFPFQAEFTFCYFHDTLLNAQSQDASYLIKRNPRAWIVAKQEKALDLKEIQGFDFGGDKEDRTPDLLNAIQALSQLSYNPKVDCKIIKF